MSQRAIDPPPYRLSLPPIAYRPHGKALSHFVCVCVWCGVVMIDETSPLFQ